MSEEGGLRKFSHDAYISIYPKRYAHNCCQSIYTVTAASLRILACNASGLTNLIKEIKLFLATHNIDIPWILESRNRLNAYKNPHYSHSNAYYAKHPYEWVLGESAIIIKSLLITI